MNRKGKVKGEQRMYDECIGFGSGKVKGGNFDYRAVVGQRLHIFASKEKESDVRVSAPIKCIWPGVECLIDRLQSNDTSILSIWKTKSKLSL